MKIDRRCFRAATSRLDASLIEGSSAAVVPVPTVGVDPRVALATAVHAAPGVFAILVGSGMSTGAGVPTGWGVVADLVRRVASATGAAMAELGDDPIEWWRRRQGSEPRYDQLLEQLCPTEPMRKALLRDYFEVAAPTSGHQELAELCREGRVRLILTTNFDRLIERALDEVGMTPQVIWEPSQLPSMTPLVHEALTVVKLHGDYMASPLRNTEEELATYPPKLRAFLARVLDEFGLITVGWSADYDRALARALLESPTRRYPMFWVTHQGHLSDTARSIVAFRKAVLIDAMDADEFLSDTRQRLSRLDQVSIRRERPRVFHSQRHMHKGRPEGWTVNPLLIVRVTAELGPASADEVGLVRAESRERLLRELATHDVTTQVRTLAAAPPASTTGTPLSREESMRAATPGNWEPTPGGYQSSSYATYRLGGDATVGASALVTVRFPPYGSNGVVVFQIDVGISLVSPLQLWQLVRILKAGILLVAASMPEVFNDILPPDTDVQRIEVHIHAPRDDGSGNGGRTNPLSSRLDMTPLGAATRDVPAMGFAAGPSTPITDTEAAELAVQAIDYMAYGSGYVDPRIGIASLRQHLGLTPKTY